jgi:hypothetical protein
VEFGHCCRGVVGISRVVFRSGVGRLCPFSVVGATLAVMLKTLTWFVREV